MHVRSPHLSTLLVLVLLALGGCVSTGAGAASGGRDVITREQLAEMGAGSLYEAVERFHPEWLRQRLYDQPPIVFVDGTRLGSPDALYTININNVIEVRYLDASDATTRYGTGFGGGAIQVHTRHGA